MNQAIVIGNLGADAEVKESNGQKFISLSVADSRKYKKQDGTEVTSTSWVDAIISNADHPILPYLKQGVKVCIIGQSTLRVYSSKKDRMMKAGQTIHVQSIELCGGSSDDVPRSLIDPSNGQIFPVNKYYAVQLDTSAWGDGDSYILVDAKGVLYQVVKGGWVQRMQPVSADQNQESASQEGE